MTGTVSQGLTGSALVNPLLSLVKWAGTIDYSFPTPAEWTAYFTAPGRTLPDYGTWYPTGADPDGPGPLPVPGFNELSQAVMLNAQQIAAAERAFADVVQFTNLSIAREIFDPVGVGDIRMGMTNTPDPAKDSDPNTPGTQWTAYAWYPGSGKDGDTWFNTTLYNAPVLGTYAYQTFYHEIGHALGLKHPHESDTFAGGNALTLSSAWDSIEFTTMTYRSHVGSPTDRYRLDAGDYPQSFMMLDIAALQAMYGADFFSGATVDSVYTFSRTTGEMFINGVGQGTPTQNTLFRTVWDNGGNDTYDFANYTAFESMRIDLRPGEPGDPDIGWTDVDVGTNLQAARLNGGLTPTPGDDIWARGQVANAMLFNGDLRSLIENAIAGAGNDTIIGNQGRNRLEGRNGADSLAGLDGDDTLIGGLGVGFLGDTLDGGNGTDLALYTDSGEAVRVDLSGVYGKGFGGTAQGDILISVEDIVASEFNDTLIGTAGVSNDLRGGNSNDFIDGRGGADYSRGGDNDDTIVAYGGDQVIDGGFGNFDSIASGGFSAVFDFAGNSFSVDGVGIFQVIEIEGAQGGAGGDWFRADARNFAFRGGAGNDTLIGGSGDNVLEGGAGADLLTFGAGFDYADYRGDTAGVLVDIRSGFVANGDAAGDAWTDSPEGILAGAGNDSLGGSDAANRILGRDGNDRIDGYAGDDTLDGNEGTDTIEGGLGADLLFGGDGDDLLGDTEQVILLSGVEDNADDTLFGSAGNDTLLAGGGNDSLDGGTEDDVLVGGAGADELRGGGGDDILSDHTQYVSFAGESPPVGTFVASDADTLLGGDGSDVIYASGGGDWIDGGAGVDGLVMSFADNPLAVAFTFSDVSPWTISLGGVITARVQDIESLSITAGGVRDSMIATRADYGIVFDGGLGNDLLRGGAGGDVLIGSGGNDKLYGNGGDDILVGSAGRDTLVGGAGADLFRWDVAAEGRDRILGFVSGEDRLWIDASGFGGGLVESMDLAATGRLVFGTAPTERMGQFLYDQGTGTLLWDVDGSRNKNAVLIATLDPGTTFAASDFLIVA